MPQVPKVVPETKMHSRESLIVWTRRRLNKPGRGKVVLLLIREGMGPRKIFIPSDPFADSRAALLSERSVRASAVAARRRLHVKPFADSNGNEILCICHGKDDGRELVCAMRRVSDVVLLGVPRGQRHLGGRGKEDRVLGGDDWIHGPPWIFLNSSMFGSLFTHRVHALEVEVKRE